MTPRQHGRPHIGHGEHNFLTEPSPLLSSNQEDVREDQGSCSFRDLDCVSETYRRKGRSNSLPEVYINTWLASWYCEPEKPLTAGAPTIYLGIF